MAVMQFGMGYLNEATRPNCDASKKCLARRFKVFGSIVACYLSCLRLKDDGALGFLMAGLTTRILILRDTLFDRILRVLRGVL